MTTDESLTFEVGVTGPDHEPTDQTKWYAQVVLTRYDTIPTKLKTYAFGPTPEMAMTNLAANLREGGVSI